MIWPSTDAEILTAIIKTEGGYINRADDLGGSTNMGITIDTLSSFRKCSCSDSDIQSLTVDEAEQIYDLKYLMGPNFDQLEDIKLRYAITDSAVLFGPILATQFLQAILKQPQDGVCGPKTLAAANTYPDTRYIINQLAASRVSYHCDRVVKNPSQIVFLNGWISRALTFIE